jgi:Flp pilus assembly protein CpaB
VRTPILPRSIRVRLRRPSVHLVTAVCLALLTGAIAYHYLESLAAGAARYGRPTTVAVAAADLRAGDRLGSGDVELRELPAAAVAPTAIGSRSLGRVVRRAVSAGEVLVAADLTRPGTSGLAAALPPGTVAIAVPRGDAPLRLARGDRVDLLAAVDPDGGSLAPVARDAVVVATDRSSVTVAVSEPEAGDVAAAVAAGIVVPAIRSG